MVGDEEVAPANAGATIISVDYFKDSSTATATETVIPTMGGAMGAPPVADEAT